MSYHKMKCNPWGRQVIALLLAASAGACGAHDLPFKPPSRSASILSLIASPSVISRSESVTVTCNAIDPDGDVLVYDWITDGRLRIQGALPGEHSLFNTSANARVFYPAAVRAPADTPWVQCSARDGKGGSGSAVVKFIVRD